MPLPLSPCSLGSSRSEHHDWRPSLNPYARSIVPALVQDESGYLSVSILLEADSALHAHRTV